MPIIWNRENILYLAPEGCTKQIQGKSEKCQKEENLSDPEYVDSHCICLTCDKAKCELGRKLLCGQKLASVPLNECV